MKMTMLDFPYYNLALLGKDFGIEEMPKRGTPEFRELSLAVSDVMSNQIHNLKWFKDLEPLDYSDPLSSAETDVAAFQTCIKIMQEEGVRSGNKLLSRAASEKTGESLNHFSITIPEGAQPERIKKMLKITIEAVVGSLETHRVGFFSNSEKSAALAQLPVLRQLADKGNIDDFTELKSSLDVMRPFDQRASEKYSDYKSNLSTLDSLIGRIEDYNYIQRNADPSSSSFSSSREQRRLTPEAKAAMVKSLADAEAKMVKSKAAMAQSLADAEARRVAEDDELQLALVLSQSSADAEAKKGAEDHEAQLALGMVQSFVDAEAKKGAEERPSPSLNLEDDMRSAIVASLKEAAKRKAQPYDYDQVSSALEKYEERAKRDPESQHLDRVQISHIGISSEANLRRRNKEHSLEKISALDIHKAQLESIQFTDFINSREKDIFLCPYLTGSDEVDSHWKLLRFEKEQGRITMMTIDPLVVCHKTEEIELLNALQEAITAETKGGFYMEIEETPEMLQLQDRGNNTECGPVICYIADQIAQGIPLQDIPKVDTEILRITQGQRDKTRPTKIML